VTILGGGTKMVAGAIVHIKRSNIPLQCAV